MDLCIAHKNVVGEDVEVACIDMGSYVGLKPSTQLTRDLSTKMQGICLLSHVSHQASQPS